MSLSNASLTGFEGRGGSRGGVEAGVSDIAVGAKEYGWWRMDSKILGGARGAQLDLWWSLRVGCWRSSETPDAGPKIWANQRSGRKIILEIYDELPDCSLSKVRSLFHDSTVA